MANSILVTKTNVIQDYVGMESRLVLERPNKWSFLIMTSNADLRCYTEFDWLWKNHI